MENEKIVTTTKETVEVSQKVTPPIVQIPVVRSETVTINSVYEEKGADIKETIHIFIRKKAVFFGVILFVSVVAVISLLSMLQSVVPVTVVADTDSIVKTVSPTETATQIPVPSTKETLRFKKEVYKVECGKKITVECQYTAKNGQKNSALPKLTYVSENPNIAVVDQKGNVTGKGYGMTNIKVITDTGIFTTVPLNVTLPKSYKIKYVPYIYQGEKYLSGCESVSTVMLLQYMGFKITVEDFIDHYLPQGEFTFNKKGEMCAVDPYTAFLGSPYDEGSLGCYPNVIKKAVDKYFKEKKKTENYRVVDLTGVSLKHLTQNYIVNNQPVVIWATMFMANPVVTEQWIVEGADKDSPYKDGDTFEWKANEHCMLLVGYDEDYYYLHDPLSDKETAYDKTTFEDRFAKMGRFALVIEKIS